jgi:bacterioferritin-associated ferredoxin
MYVCICNAVTEKMIRTAVADGVSTLAELNRRTGCAGGCGNCAEFAGEVLASALRARTRQPFALAVAQAA